MTVSNEVLLEKSILHFPLYNDQIPTSDTVCLHNNSPEFVTFKVKTTNTRQYAVRPNLSLIPPHESVDVTIVYNSKKRPNVGQSGDKFLVQLVTIPDIPADFDSKKFWKDRKNAIKGIPTAFPYAVSLPVTEHRLTVQFIEPSARRFGPQRPVPVPVKSHGDRTTRGSSKTNGFSNRAQLPSTGRQSFRKPDVMDNESEADTQVSHQTSDVDSNRSTRSRPEPSPKKTPSGKSAIGSKSAAQSPATLTLPPAAVGASKSASEKKSAHSEAAKSKEKSENLPANSARQSDAVSAAKSAQRSSAMSAQKSGRSSERKSELIEQALSKASKTSEGREQKPTSQHSQAASPNGVAISPSRSSQKSGGSGAAASGTKLQTVVQKQSPEARKPADNLTVQTGLLNFSLQAAAPRNGVSDAKSGDKSSIQEHAEAKDPTPPPAGGADQGVEEAIVDKAEEKHGEEATDKVTENAVETTADKDANKVEEKSATEDLEGDKTLAVPVAEIKEEAPAEGKLDVPDTKDIDRDDDDLDELDEEELDGDIRHDEPSPLSPSSSTGTILDDMPGARAELQPEADGEDIGPALDISDGAGTEPSAHSPSGRSPDHSVGESAPSGTVPSGNSDSELSDAPSNHFSASRLDDSSVTFGNRSGTLSTVPSGPLTEFRSSVYGPQSDVFTSGTSGLFTLDDVPGSRDYMRNMPLEGPPLWVAPRFSPFREDRGILRPTAMNPRASSVFGPDTGMVSGVPLAGYGASRGASHFPGFGEPPPALAGMRVADHWPAGAYGMPYATPYVDVADLSSGNDEMDRPPRRRRTKRSSRAVRSAPRQVEESDSDASPEPRPPPPAIPPEQRFTKVAGRQPTPMPSPNTSPQSGSDEEMKGNAQPGDAAMQAFQKAHKEWQQENRGNGSDTASDVAVVGSVDDLGDLPGNVDDEPAKAAPAARGSSTKNGNGKGGSGGAKDAADIPVTVVRSAPQSDKEKLEMLRNLQEQLEEAAGNLDRVKGDLAATQDQMNDVVEKSIEL